MPSVARAWAGRFILSDLASRYLPGDLAHVRHALHRAETATAGQTGDRDTGQPTPPTPLRALPRARERVTAGMEPARRQPAGRQRP